MEGSEPGESETREPGRAEDYPIADFIEPTEYDWDLNKFKAEQALRRYLKDSDADH